MKKSQKIKLTKEQLKIIKRYYKARGVFLKEFCDAEEKLETFMNRDLKATGLDIQVEFWYSDDGSCPGVGSFDLKDRKRFELIDLESRK